MMNGEQASGEQTCLRLFRQLHLECAAGVLVHAGRRVEHLGDGIVAVPWQVLAGSG